ncbi:NADH:flavin oxidoreductase [Acinetobacter baumannii]|uniref:NADH:flavin oxidoreductase n=1 Tax=Acinetobacter baumannii TaxID=470 RepID=UPI00244A35D5|nr:NADH:flavin oxidoreductase [Acinetobacter baumannii]MDH2498738.1 NADH:flavin oxidoreductase [Acinetobacter baumannii]
MDISSLFTEDNISSLRLPNRVVVAPMTRVTASEDGIPSTRMKEYYEDFASGGFGLIITEGTYIDMAWSQTYSYQGGIVNSKQAAGWRVITDAVHAQGGRIFSQLQHSGALSQGNYYLDGTVGPSAIRPVGEQMKFYRGEGEYRIPRELNDEDIENIIQSFANAAVLAVTEAGFDGIEIHGANGYLLDQFFTDYTNHRTDKWGGDIAGRLSMSLAVIRAVRTRVGADIPLGIRISQGKVNDFFHKWAHGENDARVVFTLLAESGIDFLHLTEFEAWQPAFEGNPLSLVALARKYAPNLMIIANGSLHDIDKAIKVLQDGADYIALGRGALANHDWPKRIKYGERIHEFDSSILRPIADIKDSELLRLEKE